MANQAAQAEGFVIPQKMRGAGGVGDPLASCEFLLDPRRLTVALSRAKRKMILVASRSIFSLFSTDQETFINSLLWKNLLLRTCSTLLWEGERGGKKVAVWGGS